MKAHLPKRIFWWFLSLFAFIIASALLIFYAAGFTYDFHTHKIVKTGIVYLTVNPSDDLKITVDGRVLATKSPAKIAYLSPGKHNIRIEKNGYKNWHREYDVKANNVIYEYNVNLFLEKPEQTVLKKNIYDYVISNDNKRIAYNQSGALYLGQLSDDRVNNAVKISENPSVKMVWSQDGDGILYKNDYWYFYNKQNQKTNIPNSINNLMLIDQRAYYIQNNVLCSYDINIGKTDKRFPNIFAMQYINSNKLLVSNKIGTNYYLSYINLSNGKISKVAESNYTITQIKKDDNKIVALDLAGSLMILDGNDLKTIKTNIKLFELSKNTRFFLNTRGKNGIYYITKLDEVFFYSADEKKEYFITRVSGKISSTLAFLYGDVLLFVEDGNIKTVDGSSINIYQIGSTMSSVDDFNGKLIYVDLNGNLVLAKVN